MPKPTATQIATWVGCVIAILIAVLDTWAFGQKFGSQVDLILLGAGIGGLIGSSVPLVGVAVSNAISR